MAAEKRSILFIDDDIGLLNGLRRSLHAASRDWNLYFIRSGKEALEFLRTTPIDVVVSDLQMPEMDGMTLLETISNDYPHIIRFVFSGHIDQELNVKTARVAHQFISKPCDTRFLQNTIRNSLRLRDLQSDPKLLSIVTGIKKLPSLPHLYMRLTKELSSPNASALSLSRIIEQDITMTAKILQLVNSAFYGLPSKITNTQHAIAMLGINTIKSLVLGQQVFSEFWGDGAANFSVDQLWKHSLQVSHLSKLITAENKGSKAMQDDAHVAGMLHDIGKLIQVKIPRFYEKMSLMVAMGVPPLQAEYRILGTSHAELGAYLLGIWGLPDTIVQATAYHHLPMHQHEENFSALTAIHVSDVLLSDYKKPAPANSPAVSNFDVEYLQQVNVLDKIPIWTELYQQTKDKDIVSLE